MSFEQQLSKGMFNSDKEKTFIDKLLAKEDVNRIRELIRKSRLNREDLLEVLYLISGNEAKLLNYSEWDRYVVLKFFVWIREFIKAAELLFDYIDHLEDLDEPVDKDMEQLLDNCQRLIEHNAKFLIDLYLNIGRTSLSIGATGIMEMLKNRYELYYDTKTQVGTGDKGGFMMRGNKT